MNNTKLTLLICVCTKKFAIKNPYYAGINDSTCKSIKLMIKF